MGQLGRRTPTNWKHVEHYPLAAAAAVAMKPTPVAIGVNWYENFDAPQRDSHGHYWIGRGDLGRVRGGHCVALKPAGITDPKAWQVFYDQGAEGACVGFGCSRMMSLLNRKRYDAPWLWDRAKEADDWPDTNPGDTEGTSVSAALDVLRTEGHVRDSANNRWRDWEARLDLVPSAADGISANRWIRGVEDLLEVLGTPTLQYVSVLNSWGTSYPHVVRVPLDTVDRLWSEDGEFGVVTDR